MKWFQALAFGLLVSACGSESDESAAPASAPHSLYIVDATALPECKAEAEGWLVYLKSESKFMACSSGTWEEVIIKSESPAPVPAEPTAAEPPASAPAAAAPATPTATKLMRGMSKSEVQTIIGPPESVNSNEYFTTWYLDLKFCGADSYSCFLRFTPAGVLDEVGSVDPKYIDVTTF